MLALNTKGSNIFVLDFTTRNVSQLSAGGESSSAVTALAFSRAGDKLAVGRADGTIRIYDVSSEITVASLVGAHTGLITALAFDDSDKTLASGSPDSTVRLWGLGTSQEPLLLVFKGHPYGITSVAFVPRQRAVISGGQDHTVQIWSTTTGAPLTGHSLQAQRVGWSRRDLSFLFSLLVLTGIWIPMSRRCALRAPMLARLRMF